MINSNRCGLKGLAASMLLPLGLLTGGLNAGGAEGRSAEILHHYTLPAFSLENLGFSAEELAEAAANGLPTADLPALGSGMQWLGGNYFVGVSDRGQARRGQHQLQDGCSH